MTGGFRDRGFVTAVETMYLLVLVVVAVAFVAYLGRTGAVGIEITNVAQDAARSASLADGPVDAERRAREAVGRSGLDRRCEGGPSLAVDHLPSIDGSWRGGSVTVRVGCRVRNSDLAAIALPGTRTLSASDTQVVDRFRP